MTKFIDKLVDVHFHGITDSEAYYLLEKLESFMKDNKKSISIIVDRFQKSKKKYSVFELSDTVIVVLNKCKTKKIILNVGYPFPIFSKNWVDSVNSFAGNNFEMKLFIRGEVLRKLQRNYFKKNFFRSFENKKWVIVNDIKKFRKISANLLNKKNKIIYVDPYHFIGDAFTGLYFLEQFQLRSTITNVVVLSRFFKHLNLFCKSYNKDQGTFKKVCTNGSIIIMPDLIDNHFGESLKLLSTIKNKNLVVFMLSRNLILHYQKNKVEVYHLNKKDILLKNKNIENYMDDCLTQFLKSKFIFNYRKNNVFHGKKRIAKIFISPYSSNLLKEIPVELFMQIAYELSKNNNIQFIISNNRGTMGEENKWTNKVLLKIKKGKYKKLRDKIKFISDKNICDLGKKLLKKQVICALIADTSISHVLSKLMIPNITVYNENFWDKNSRQSLSAESPLGFCRYALPQFAAILAENYCLDKFSDDIRSGLQTLLNISLVDNETRLKIPREISKFHKVIRNYVMYPTKSLSYHEHRKLYTEYLILKKCFAHSELSWIFNIYDPDRIIAGINKNSDKKNRFLIYSSWKNLPLYKFINYLRY